MMILLAIVFIPIFFPDPVRDVKRRLQETFAGPEEGLEEVILWFKVKEMCALARIEKRRWILIKVLPHETFVRLWSYWCGTC